jgi:pimeloyl-ACP methyl ester carboxylesterase
LTQRLLVETPDGRGLDALVSGEPGSIPLVMNHGTPASNVQFGDTVQTALSKGLRLLTYSRPGYGGSDRAEGRRVVDCAADVAAILDAIGAERCYVAGASGGGPHALAIAASLPDRVISCASIAGVAPYSAEGLDWLAGMGQANLDEFGLAADDHAGLVEFMEKEGSALSGATPEDIVTILGSLLPPVDVEALTDEFARNLVDSTVEGLRSGIWGWYDDDLAFVSPWGIDLTSFQVPVTIWQGAQDLMVPYAHGEWLAGKIVGSKAELLPAHGHLSLSVAHFGDVVDDLVAAGH